MQIRRTPLLLLALSSTLGAAALLGGCADSCEVLADRICECEPTPSARATCRQERIDKLKGQVDPTESDLAICDAALDTCDCQALDENRVELCGYVREDDA